MKRDELFERLEPPPGGLAALRARMDADARPRRARLFAPLAFAAVVAAIAVFALIRGQRAPDPVAVARQHGDASQVALGLAPMPTAVVTLEADESATTALAEVPTRDPKVAFYWVSSTTWRD